MMLIIILYPKLIKQRAYYYPRWRSYIPIKSCLSVYSLYDTEICQYYDLFIKEWNVYILYSLL